MVFLSVIIPSFNNKKNLSLTLKYFYKQNTPLNPEEIEVIVVNDGSTDGTEEVIRYWQGKVRNLKVINHLKNRGPAAARNSGAENAQGKLLLFLDSDIIMSPDILDTHLSYFLKNGNSDVIILSEIYNFKPEAKDELYEYLDDAEELNENYLKNNLTEEIDPYFDIRHEILNSGEVNNGVIWVFGALFCSTMYKSTWEKVGCFDEKFTGWGPEDIEFVYRAYKNDCKLVYKSDSVCFHLDFRKKDKNILFQSVQRNAKYLYAKHPNKDIKNYLRFYKGDISFEEFDCLHKDVSFKAEEYKKLHYLGILKFLFKKTE